MTEGTAAPPPCCRAHGFAGTAAGSDPAPADDVTGRQAKAADRRMN
ncbi:hypothetical protein ABMY26_29865 [Azospirillum sp. HJ39]